MDGVGGVIEVAPGLEFGFANYRYVAAFRHGRHWHRIVFMPATNETVAMAKTLEWHAEKSHRDPSDCMVSGDYLDDMDIP